MQTEGDSGMQEGSCGAEPFALRVIGDSMAPEFKDGCIIIIDPEGVISDGCYVLARHEDGYIFRQLIYAGGTYLLKALQKGESIVIPDLTPVAGLCPAGGAQARRSQALYLRAVSSLIGRDPPGRDAGGW
jgi:hypothetical protein